MLNEGWGGKDTVSARPPPPLSFRPESFPSLCVAWFVLFRGFF